MATAPGDVGGGDSEVAAAENKPGGVAGTSTFAQSSHFFHGKKEVEPVVGSGIAVSTVKWVLPIPR